MTSPDTPVAGYYRTKLVRNGPWCPVWIWHGPPYDPATGEWADRSHAWRACLNGNQVDVWSVWPAVASHPIEWKEYRWMLALADHARAHEPAMPEAAPHEPIDHNKLKPVF